MPKQWFHNWFGSPYYHILYSERNNHEAAYFVTNLVKHLQPAPHARIIDIACGRGRHAVCLNKKGYDVTGIDLAVDNIRYAKSFESPTLHFYVHDMRTLAYSNHFDMAFNLFTSFGYFDTDEEHVAALKAFNCALKKDGLLVLDFFNSTKVLDDLVPEAVKTVHGIHFRLQRRLDGNKIIKTIKFEDKNEDYEFQEIVHAFTFDNFARLFELSGFEIVECFGNYSLEKFDINHSDRLIFICKKANV